MTNNRSRLDRLKEAIARLKAERTRTDPIDLSGMTDEELDAFYNEQLGAVHMENPFPADFTDQQYLEAYALTFEGFSIQEAISRVK